MSLALTSQCKPEAVNRLTATTFQPVVIDQQQQNSEKGYQQNHHQPQQKVQSISSHIPSNQYNYQQHPHHIQQQQNSRSHSFLLLPSAFHQSNGSDTSKPRPPQIHSSAQASTATETIETAVEQLGRLDGIVSNPGARTTKCRSTDSKRIAAILLESNVIELRRHLLTLTAQNQVSIDI